MLAEIKDILIIYTPRDINIVGNGNTLELNIQYAVQEYPNWLVEAFIIEEFIRYDKVRISIRW